MSTPTVYILLPVYNRKNITQKFLTCLKKQTYTNYHLIVIDDGSVDHTSEMVQQEMQGKRYTIITGRGAWWWAGSLQQGIKKLSALTLSPNDIIVMINDDTEIDKRFLEKGVKLLEKYKKTLIVARCVSKYKGPQAVNAVIFDPTYSLYAIEPVSYAQAVNSLTTRGLFLRWKDVGVIGPFHPTLLPQWHADLEYTIRASRKGYRLMVARKLIVKVNNRVSKNFRLPKTSNILTFLRFSFSNRYDYNPLRLTFFSLCVSPRPYVVSNIVMIWKKYLKQVLVLLSHDKNYG